ncbi:hypothetical protein AB0A69_10415 [Streptomyces sp. NPDC045431]|uniref:hypothetical protein n=1 Tax=Streptomyces sp. NPDC045431 TaxID=3155613 RepID=UPI00340EA259
MTTHAPQVLSEFRTGFLTTRVSRTGTGTILWQHTPGPDRDQPFPTVPVALLDLLAAASSPVLTWVAPTTATAHEVAWETDGRHSLAAALESDSHTDRQIETIGAHLGAQLRRFHDLSRVQDHAAHRDAYPPRPPGLTRLRSWLDQGRGTRAAPAFHYRLRSRLGSRRWGRLNELTDHLLQPGGDETATALHGWFSMGGIVLGDRPGTEAISVLSGPDTCWGRPEIDLGCLVGELTEYRIAARRKGIAWPVLGRLQRAFLAHYGTADTEAVAAGALLRVATHAHDYASYVGWSEQLHGYVPMLTELLDDPLTALQPV